MCLQIPPPSYESLQNHCNFAADKVEQVAEASFTRARQQVQRTNIACGFDAQEPILAGIDSQYNNRLQSASDTTPMQPATQVSTSIIEMQTKQKKIIGMHVFNKLCSRGDHTTCDDKGGCTKNLLETDVIGKRLYHISCKSNTNHIKSCKSNINHIKCKKKILIKVSNLNLHTFQCNTVEHTVEHRPRLCNSYLIFDQASRTYT